MSASRIITTKSTAAQNNSRAVYREVSPIIIIVLRCDIDQGNRAFGCNSQAVTSVVVKCTLDNGHAARAGRIIDVCADVGRSTGIHIDKQNISGMPCDNQPAVSASGGSNIQVCKCQASRIGIRHNGRIIAIGRIGIIYDQVSQSDVGRIAHTSGIIAILNKYTPIDDGTISGISENYVRRQAQNSLQNQRIDEVGNRHVFGISSRLDENSSCLACRFCVINRGLNRCSNSATSCVTRQRTRRAKLRVRDCQDLRRFSCHQRQ